MSFLYSIFEVVLTLHIERAWLHQPPFSFLILLVQEPVVFAYSFLSFCSNVDLAPPGSYSDACDVSIPHSIGLVNVSNEIEVGIVFGVVFEIKAYLCPIGRCHDSIPEVSVCLAC